MTDHDLAIRNAAKLAEINPTARHRFKAVLSDLQTHGWRPRIQCAFRTKRDQMIAFREGHSRVTWGYHNAMNAHGAPDALAADIIDDDNPLDPPAKFKGHLRASARVHGLSAPIDWDPCHVQITGISLELELMREVYDAAMAYVRHVRCRDTCGSDGLLAKHYALLVAGQKALEDTALPEATDRIDRADDGKASITLDDVTPGYYTPRTLRANTHGA